MNKHVLLALWAAGLIAHSGPAASDQRDQPASDGRCPLSVRITPPVSVLVPEPPWAGTDFYLRVRWGMSPIREVRHPAAHLAWEITLASLALDPAESLADLLKKACGLDVAVVAVTRPLQILDEP